MNGDQEAPPRFLGDHPHGAYWSAEPPAAAPADEDDAVADLSVSGTVIRLMWDYGVTVPLWDAEGLLPDDPRWLRSALGLSTELVEALTSWGLAMNRLDGQDDGLTDAARRAAYDLADVQGRDLAEQLQRELATRFEVRYIPW